MAQFKTVAVANLDVGLVLAPERYDPRRSTNGADGTLLGELAEIVTDQVSSRSCRPDQRFLVLDTGDAQEGVIRASKMPVDAEGIGSTKKRIQPGDVIISRLRPYLRQVAYVDPGLLAPDGDVAQLLCSTEFFVLRSKGRPIAFLVPFLLSDQVQTILAAAQEGGHHPRFNAGTLRNLVIPTSVLEKAPSISEEVIRAVMLHRESENTRRQLVTACNDPIG